MKQVSLLKILCKFKVVITAREEERKVATVESIVFYSLAKNLKQEWQNVRNSVDPNNEHVGVDYVIP